MKLSQDEIHFHPVRWWTSPGMDQSWDAEPVTEFVGTSAKGKMGAPRLKLTRNFHKVTTEQ